MLVSNILKHWFQHQIVGKTFENFKLPGQNVKSWASILEIDHIQAKGLLVGFLVKQLPNILS